MVFAALFVLAHADHPEMFFFGLLVGTILVAGHLLFQRVRRK